MASTSIQVFDTAGSSSSSSGQSIISQVTQMLNGYETTANHSSDIEGIRTDINTNADNIADVSARHAHDTSILSNDQDVMKQDIADLQALHDGSVTPNQYYVAELKSINSNDSAFTNFKGNPEVAADFDAYLLDCTDNAREYTTPIRKLRRFNYLRDSNGAYAPVVYVTESMNNMLSANTVYNGSGTAVTYSAASLWEIDKPLIKANPLVEHPTKLYSDSAHTTELTHYPRPWETTHAEYSIGNANNKTLYILDTLKNSAGTKQYVGLFRSPITWDGITEHHYYKLAPTAVFPSPFVSINSKARCLFYAAQPVGLDSNCKSNNANSFGLVNPTGRVYPHTSNVNQEKCMRNARANNKDASLPYPFAEGGLLAIDSHIMGTQLLAGTRAIAVPNLYGSGISSNDGAPANAEGFYKYGGIRTCAANTAALSADIEDASVNAWAGITWTYYTWNGNTPSGMIGTATNWSNATTAYCPKEECMESQMAYSYAKEVGIPATTDFTAPNLFAFYGNIYYYAEVTGSNIPNNGMNARVYKLKIIKNFGSSTKYDIMFCQRMSLYQGMNLSGDIWRYEGGGYEQVGQIATENADTGNPVKFYVMPDQTKWVWNTVVGQSAANSFGFEDTYRVIDTFNDAAILTHSEGYVRVRVPYTGFGSVFEGSSNGTGEGYYHYATNTYWTKTPVGYKTRAYVLRGGHAYNPNCSPRYLLSAYSASDTDSRLGGSAQALVGV